MTATYADYEKLQISLDQGVATVCFHNPPINLLDRALAHELRRALDQLEQDDAVRVIVFRSRVDGWFMAHYDINLVLDAPAFHGKRVKPWGMQLMIERLRSMPKATIAVIEARAGGGGSELALACDMRFASPQAIFNQPEVALGLLPAGGGSQRLPRLIGRSRALEVILGCDDIDAGTAERWGYVNRVLPESQLSDFVARLATRIASFPAYAVAAAKAAVLLAEGSMTTPLTQEIEASDPLANHPETKAALRRFLELGAQTPGAERRLAELLASVWG